MHVCTHICILPLWGKYIHTHIHICHFLFKEIYSCQPTHVNIGSYEREIYIGSQVLNFCSNEDDLKPSPPAGVLLQGPSQPRLLFTPPLLLPSRHLPLPEGLCAPLLRFLNYPGALLSFPLQIPLSSPSSGMSTAHC